MQSKGISRRSFFALAGGAVAAPLIIPARALGREAGVPAASERVTMAFIGCGGMGRADYGAFRADARVQVVALADPDRQHLTEMAATVREDYGDGLQLVADFREVLARPDIDAVCIAVPDHWHALLSIAAMKAGKDVYCEKPLALTIAEGRAIADCVKQHARVLQVGSQQRSGPDFRRACELVRNGVLGELHRVVVGIPAGPPESGIVAFTPPPEHLDYDLWLGPAPYEPYAVERLHWNFRWNYDYSGGMVTDWGAHHIDIAHWGLGKDLSGPVLVHGTAVYPKSGIWNTPMTYSFRLEYEDAAPVEASSEPANGVRFEGEKGWIFVDRQQLVAEPSNLLSATFGPGDVRLAVSPGHQRNFIDCVFSRAEPIVPAEVGHRSITACHLANISMRLGRPVRWDPVREMFPGDDEANRWISRPMRAPWRLG